MSDAINPDHYKRLPAEAIEIIEAVIGGAPSKRAAYLHGQVLKYVLRCWSKNGIEDLCKAKWYLDRLIGSFNASEPEQPATGEVTVEGTGEVKPPDGWRWLEVGEKLFFGDTTVDGDGKPYLKSKISKQYCERHTCQLSKTFVRRNKFEVGEKVVYTIDNTIWTFKSEIDDGPRFPKSAWVTSVTGIGKMSQRTCVNHLAPYLEETK